MTNIKKERKLGRDRKGLSTLLARKFLVGTQGRRGVVWFAEGSYLGCCTGRHRTVLLAVGLP